MVAGSLAVLFLVSVIFGVYGTCSVHDDFLLVSVGFRTYLLLGSAKGCPGSTCIDAEVDISPVPRWLRWPVPGM